MKKVFLFTCLFFCLLLSLMMFSSCNQSVCEKEGSHELEYASSEFSHWQECIREGCAYKTEEVRHGGGTATCVTKAKCETCGALYGSFGTHDLLRVSCTEPLQCKNCDFTDGEISRHMRSSWVEDADACSKYNECVDCGYRFETVKFHTVASDGITCAKCGVNIFEDTVEFELNADGTSYILVSAECYTAKSIEIPAEYKGLPVTEIGIGAFSWNSYVETVILPDTIRVIDELAFESSPIKSIVIPDSVETIGPLAFSGSTLESIVFGKGIKEIGSSAFDNTNLKKVIFPGTVEVLESAVFSECKLLEEVVIEDGVKVIASQAFYDCPNLKTIVLPSTLSDTENGAFDKTPSLEYTVHGGLKYLGSATNPYFALVGSAGAVHAVIHSETEFCMMGALYDCEDIVSLELGASVRTIEELALKGMDSLESITVAAGNPNYYVINNILVDAKSNTTILGCKTSVIPEDGRLSEIDLTIFSYNASVKTIYIPKGVKTVHVNFQALSGLEWIVFESDVELVVVHGNSDGCKGQEGACYSVFYLHTEAEWKQVTVEYAFNKNALIRPADCYGDHATHYFYSEDEPEDDGNYWHYVDGVPTPW